MLKTKKSSTTIVLLSKPFFNFDFLFLSFFVRQFLYFLVVCSLFLIVTIQKANDILKPAVVVTSSDWLFLYSSSSCFLGFLLSLHFFPCLTPTQLAVGLVKVQRMEF